MRALSTGTSRMRAAAGASISHITRQSLSPSIPRMSVGALDFATSRGSSRFSVRPDNSALCGIELQPTNSPRNASTPAML